MSFSRTAFVLFLIFILSPFSTPAFAMSEEEKSFLLMYFKEEEIQVISATRSLKSITRIAENVEVVSANDIKLMNAHTVADVINTVNGVQIFFSGASPGSIATANIQGSRSDHVIVLIDGINFAYLSTNISDISQIPVQMIDRIEVIKGPASSAWGSSLGGVINIITKGPGPQDIGGMISGSYGERNTGDFRAEITGRKGALGYYLFAGRLQTDGLRKWEDLSQNDLYAKFTYGIGKDSSLMYTLFYNKGDRNEGNFESLGFSQQDETRNLLTSLTFRSKLSDTLGLEIAARAAEQKIDYLWKDLISASESPSFIDDKKYGGSVKLDWKKGIHSAVFGGDYDFSRAEADIFGGRKFDKNVWAVFANDTIALGKLSVTPGLRYDDIHIKNTSIDTNFVSPSLGITYELRNDTLLRGYVARGFSIPSINSIFVDSSFYRSNPALTLEKVWSYQIGIETGILKYLWLKLAAFRHDIKNAITIVSFEDGSWTYANEQSLKRQGLEIEMKTLPIYNFILTAGATFIYAKDPATDEQMTNNPQYTYDIGLQYDDKKTFRALLKGRYVWFNATSDYEAEYGAFIFDATAFKTIYKNDRYSAEAFLGVHNVFDGSQYWWNVYSNARRWFEVGLQTAFQP